MKETASYRRPALALTLFLLLLSLGSLPFLLTGPKETDYAADIFQDGILIKTIYLGDIRERQVFSVTGESGCFNEIEVQTGSIAILSADCPDRLCVRQGAIRDSRLPITCLPNRLVIWLRPASREDSPAESEAPDAVTY